MKRVLLYVVLITVVAGGAAIWLTVGKQPDSHNHAEGNHHSSVDITKLPLGDNKYTTDGPKKGYVYACQSNFNGGGAFAIGPWINNGAGTWDLSAKASVDGNIAWPNASWSVNNSGQTRSFSGNGLPISHNTGVFPISSADDAYQYDRNPNSIKTQSLGFSVPTNPTALGTPECVGGEVGILLTGVPIYNAFDAGGRDAVARELQDSCDGHPQAGGQYHYHGYSDCLEDNAGENAHSELLGYAFDGYGIYGLKGEDGIELSSNDLDECHGHSHKITWDGKDIEMYHYHLTLDFPYSVSCFRAKKQVTKPLSSDGEPVGIPEAPLPR